MNEAVQTAERRDSPEDELTPEEYAQLGKALARVMFAAWVATHDRPGFGARTGTSEPVELT